MSRTVPPEIINAAEAIREMRQGLVHHGSQLSISDKGIIMWLGYADLVYSWRYEAMQRTIRRLSAATICTPA